MKKPKVMLQDVLASIQPSAQEQKDIAKLFKESVAKLKKAAKKLGVQVFVGGSFAKNTLIKKHTYDIDVYLRFDKKFSDKEIQKKFAKIMKKFSNKENIHGSRDYYRVRLKKNVVLEIVPVKKIRHSGQAENITDLSYSHVRYVKNKTRDASIREAILLAKAFCYASECYGAESYINGFSGYALELLLIYYKDFMKFVRALSKERKEQLIIDLEKLHPTPKHILLDLNSSKLASPIILIDPTCKQRNALAALSRETFEKLQKKARAFLKHPSRTYFEKKQKDFSKVENAAKKKGLVFVKIMLQTDKQTGDIAGSKLKKFFTHLSTEIKKRYDIKNKDFSYESGQSAECFFVTKKKKEIILEGPFVDDKKNVVAFTKMHNNTFIKKNKIYAKEKVKDNLKVFLEKWKKKYQQKISAMKIVGIKIR